MLIHYVNLMYRLCREKERSLNSNNQNRDREEEVEELEEVVKCISKKQTKKNK